MTAYPANSSSSNDENQQNNLHIDDVVTPKSDFSIDHILNRAGISSVTNTTRVKNEEEIVNNYNWLQCSRYCPPKVPRVSKKDNIQKRQLGRHPRIPFTSYQLSVLEEKFKFSPYLSSEEVISISRKLQLADIRVKIWFQNRRARERRERNSVDLKDPKKICCSENNVDNNTQLLRNTIRNSESSFLDNNSSDTAIRINQNVDLTSYNNLSASVYSNLPFFVPRLNFFNDNDVNKRNES